MRFKNLDPSEHVWEVVCPPENPLHCATLPVINFSPQPSLPLCIYLFALTFVVAWWLDVFFFKARKEF